MTVHSVVYRRLVRNLLIGFVMFSHNCTCTVQMWFLTSWNWRSYTILCFTIQVSITCRKEVMSGELVLVSATSTGIIFSGNMYKAPPLDRKRRKVYFCLRQFSFLFQYYCTFVTLCTIFLVEMARAFFCVAGKSHFGSPQVCESCWIQQDPQKNNRPPRMHQPRDWPWVQELRTHSQLGNVQEDVLPSCTEWCSHATVGQCAGENQECTGWYVAWCWLMHALSMLI